jgi:hypothetical protein
LVQTGGGDRQWPARTNAVAVTTTGSWTIHKVGSSPAIQGLDEAYVSFFGAFGAA